MPTLVLGSVPANAAPPAAFFAGIIIIWVVLLAAAVASFAFAIVCIVDIARRPDWQWTIAGQQKTTWLLLVILINLFVIPLVMSFVYWFSIRRKLVAVEQAAKAGQFGSGFMTQNGWVPGHPMQAPPAGVAPGWFPDPGGSGHMRYWDGVRWTEHTNAAGPPPP